MTSGPIPPRTRSGRPWCRRLSASQLNLILVFCLALPGGLRAQEEHGVHGEEHQHKNHIALFIGSTQAEVEHGKRDDPQFTLGLDYERRLTQVVGIGALLDVVLEGHREGIIGVPVFLHAGSLTFQLAPGGERNPRG